MSFFLDTILLFFSISNFSNTSASLTRDLCRPDQRDALLEFKSKFELHNPPDILDEYLHGYLIPADVTSYPRTESWGNNSDCCNWDGITCDANSGEVIGLDLSFSCLHGHFKPNSSLFRLPHLRNLNLAYINVNASPIPIGLNKFIGLERLNLSHSLFFGQISNRVCSSDQVGVSRSFFFFYVFSKSLIHWKAISQSTCTELDKP